MLFIPDKFTNDSWILSVALKVLVTHNDVELYQNLNLQLPHVSHEKMQKASNTRQQIIVWRHSLPYM
jgi:hypothetical protein